RTRARARPRALEGRHEGADSGGGRPGMSLAAPPPPSAGRAEEDRYLWRAFRHHARTFSLATRLLPRRVRLPVATLYLYCRTVDGIADERGIELGTDGALAELDAARARLACTLAGRPPSALLWRRLAEVHAVFD